MTFKGSKYLSAIVCFVILLSVCTIGCASALVELECSIGYDDQVTYLRNLPINVAITNHGGDTSGVIVVDVNRSTTQYDRYEAPVTVASGATVNVTLPIIITQKQSSYTVQWLVDGMVQAEAEVAAQGAINPYSLIVGVVSSDASKLSQLSISAATDVLKRSELWQTVDLLPQSIPSDLDSMRFFDIIVVDDIDLSTLTEKQKLTFDSWLKEGGLILLGGGAQANTTFPYFQQYTGISAGALTDAGDISETLMEHFKMSAKANGQRAMAVSLEDARGTSVGSPALVDICSVEDGFIFTSAFSLSEKPFSTWQMNNVLWQRILLENAQSLYNEKVELRNRSYYSQSENYYMNSKSITVPNTGATYLPVIILFLFVILVGVGTYFPLKKIDKREWMWVTVPVLCILCTLITGGLTNMLDLNDPIAVSSALVREDTDGNSTAIANVSVARPNAGRIKISTTNGSIDLSSVVGYSYHYDSTITGTEETTELRYQTIYEDDMASVALPINGTWSSLSLSLLNISIQDHQISGECYWNGENFEFHLQNNGNIAMPQGVIFSSYGYVTVDALLPGQSVIAVLKPVPAQPQATVAASSAQQTSPTLTPAPGGVITPAAETISNGYLLSKQQLSNYSAYALLDSYYKTLKEERTDLPSGSLNVMRNALSSCFENWPQFSENFHYMVFSDQLSEFDLFVDDQKVTRTNRLDLLDVELRYSPISTDGTVHLGKGSFDVYQAALDDLKAPQLGSMIPTKNYSYYPLSAMPIFAYDVRNIPDNMTLTAFDISPVYVYTPYKTSLYNYQKKKWDEIKTYDYAASTGVGTATIILPDLSKYTSEQGFIYAMFESTLTQTRNYEEIGLPILTMDGKVK
ncbi:MAG: hypothetical protein GX096_00910 [Clostridiales bacterium]|nr:hypothetical protein [Clostridiales bacterium]